ncbi:hypothetical protein [Streptomyces mirabilis]|uniref:hypothetical protein n=1 Tax=Streptomyces mirabilis TaxID=68239 RepID=UPI00331AE79E
MAIRRLEHSGRAGRAMLFHGRTKLVCLAPEGAKALAAGTAAGEGVLRELFGAMGAEQLVNLDQLLDALRAGLPGAARPAAT